MITFTVSDIDTQVCNFYYSGSPIAFETQDLVLASVQESDLPFYQRIHTDPETMKLYADTELRLKEGGVAAWKEHQMQVAARRVALFVKRWTVDRNPFSEFVIWKKGEQRRVPIGFVVVSSCAGKPGKLEVAMVICKEEQSRAFGAQAGAILHRYLPALIENHYRIFGKPLLAEGSPVDEVFATARLDNPASNRLLEKLGMKKSGEDSNSKWGGVRNIYSLKLKNEPPMTHAKL